MNRHEKLTVDRDTLVKQAKLGDAAAFSDLIRDALPGLYKTARAVLKNDEDSADAVQEAIIACWERMGDLEEERFFKTWLTRILIRKCYDLVRRKREMASEEELAALSHREPAYERAEWDAVLQKLDEKYRLVLLLCVVEGFTSGEASEILEIPESTVRTRLMRGRDLLRRELGTEAVSASSRREFRAVPVFGAETSPIRTVYYQGQSLSQTGGIR